LTAIDTRVQVAARHRDFAIARWSRANIMLWRQNVTAEGLIAAERNHQQIAHDYGKVIGLSLIGDALVLPDADARQHAARLMRANASSQLCSVVIIEGDGLLSVAARGISSGLQLLSRTSLPFEVFATPRDAGAWCTRFFTASPLWVDELCEAVEHCRSELLTPQN
jgi:hypothetical protein